MSVVMPVVQSGWWTGLMKLFAFAWGTHPPSIDVTQQLTSQYTSAAQWLNILCSFDLQLVFHSHLPTPSLSERPELATIQLTHFYKLFPCQVFLECGGHA
jgi:hypothetical protein